MGKAQAKQRRYSSACVALHCVALCAAWN